MTPRAQLKRLALGSSVSHAQIESCLQQQLATRWHDTRNELTDGRTGWYRRLDRTDRVGNVASADAVVASSAAGTGADLDDVVATLLAAQAPDGGWRFVSTVTAVSTVDATAAVLRALCRVKQSEPVRTARARAVRFLLEAATPDEDGGWGLTAGGPYRPYSTAVVLLALADAAALDDDTVRRGLRRLAVGLESAPSGRTVGGNGFTLALTAIALRAVLAVRSDPSHHAKAVRSATELLLRAARVTDFGQSETEAGWREEVEVETDGGLVRIDYYHCPRQQALIALVETGVLVQAKVVRQVQRLVAVVDQGAWERLGPFENEPTSWALADTTVALAAVRDELARGGAGEVWAGRRRAVATAADVGRTVVVVRRHWPSLAMAVALLAFSAIAVWGVGLPATAGFLLSGVAAVAVGVAIDLVTGWLTRRMALDRVS